MNLAVDNTVSPYPSREGYKPQLLTYASDMCHIAVNRDDAVNFMRFLEECGGVDCEVFISGSVLTYAANHGAVECVKALVAAGAKSEYPLEYWLKRAEKPSAGPKAARLQMPI